LEAAAASGRVQLVGPWSAAGDGGAAWRSYAGLAEARPDVCVAGPTVADALAVQALRALGFRAVTSPGDVPVREDGAIDSFIAALAHAAARPGVALSGGPDLSVVVTVLDEADAVVALLADVTPQLRAGDELVCVDGGSTDGTVGHLQRWADRDPRVRVISAPGSNISEGRNIGVRAARHDVIACTDAGCEPSDAWLEALRAPFAEEPRPGLVASVPTVSARTALEEAQSAACYPDPHEVRHPSLFVRLYGRAFGLVFNPQLPFARSLAFTRGAWTAAGGFPEHLGWQEDGNFGRAVSRHATCVVTVDAGMTWHQRGSLRSTYLMYRRYGFSGAQSGDATLMRRDLFRAAAYVGVPLAFIAAPRRVLPLAAVAVAAYTSLPLRRLQRRHGSALAAALVPMAMMVKDVAKVHGAAEGYLAARRRRGA
jgi:glycosyltransferase involved in cell wall biosynthesis